MVSELAGCLRGAGVRQSQTAQQTLVAKDAKEFVTEAIVSVAFRHLDETSVG
jgi:hypothetical protein